MRRGAHLQASDARALAAFTSRVRSLAGPNLISLKLFGSKATGRDTPESDIDVMVVLEHMTPDLREHIIDAAFDINLAHDVYISPRVISRAVLEHPVWRITPFLQAVERDGIPL